MTDFAAFLTALGLRPRVIVADGRWRRCSTENHPHRKNGAYCLAADGRIGWAQDWAIHAEPLTWRPAGALPAALPDYREIRRRNQEANAERARAIQGARAYYAAAAPLVGGHPYLSARGLDMTGCRGLKLDARGHLVVPMTVGGEIRSVQRIGADGEKRFWPGAPTTGTSYLLLRPRAPLTVLCEGLATGLTLYAAIPTARVVVAFNAGNLAPVARSLPRYGMAVVAADNDHETEARIGRNPGLDAAREAAEILGCEVATPECEGTDWDDYRQERTRALTVATYGRRTPSEANARRQVEGEIRSQVLRGARLLRRIG
jgi:putative DNA primase/helicase